MAYAIQLRQELDRISADMTAITAKAQKERNRGLTPDELNRWKNLERDYERIEASISAAEASDKIGRSLRATDRTGIDETGMEEIRDTFRMSPQEKRRRERERDPHARAFSGYIRNGISGLGPDDRQLMEKNFLGNIQNTMSTTSGNQGGYLIPQGFSGMLEEAKKWFGGIEGTVGKFTTESGNPFPWPTLNDTTNRGRIIGQNVQVTETDPTFSQTTFNAYIGSSDLALVPLALLQDSYFDLDALLAEILGTRLGRLYNWKCTTGTGTAEPMGIIPAAVAAGNILTLGTGNATGIAYSNLVDLEHSVDPAYRYNPSTKWMFGDVMLKLLKKLVDGNNRPLWQPGLTASFQNGAGVTGSEPTILGHPYVINQDMASPAANQYTILFGDLSTFKVREVAGGTTLLRLSERFSDYLQVGYMAFQRFDSQFVNAGSNPLALLQQSAT